MLQRRLVAENIDIALIQEPWCYKGKVRGLGGCRGDIIYGRGDYNPRACIFIQKKVTYFPLLEFCSRDLATVEIKLSTGGHLTPVVIISGYLPYDSPYDPPGDLIEMLVGKCSRGKKQLILGCDANAHHILWGSSDVNHRGERLIDFILSSNLEILNRGNRPTFKNSRRQEVIDISVASLSLSDRINKWHVSEEQSLSDHNHIEFELGSDPPATPSYRNSRKTNWAEYISSLEPKLRDINSFPKSKTDTEIATAQLQSALISSYEDNCRLVVSKTTGRVPWWTDELTRLRKSTRALFNRAKRTGDWDSYKLSLTQYNRSIRRAKKDSWRNFCAEIEGHHNSSRLFKMLSKDPLNKIGTLETPEGRHTADSTETLALLIKTHFPRAVLTVDGGRTAEIIDSPRTDLESCDEATTNLRDKLSKEIFQNHWIKWAVNSFKPYKSPGPDGVFPALLQKGLDTSSLVEKLKGIFQASFTLGYIPTRWREIKVVFIPKAGRASYTQPKAFRPISLMSFLLKTMERLIDRHIRGVSLLTNPINETQFAYQKGKSTEAALHSLVSQIEASLDSKETTLSAFLDVEGAFDNTSIDVITRAVNEHAIETPICVWIKAMLQGRQIQASLYEETVFAVAGGGCPQGGVLSPLLWCLVLDDLLSKLQRKGFRVQAYADDLVISVQGKVPGVISELMTSALKVVEKWCESTGLSVNPDKTVLIPFTRRRDLTAFNNIQLQGKSLCVKYSAKYLGVILDQKLSWKLHLEKVGQKAVAALGSCKRTLGKRWGISPKVTYWLYTAVVRPSILYGAIVWWTRANLSTGQTKLASIQRKACLMITGAMSTTPTAAMETLLDLTPLHIQVMAEAKACVYRLKNTRQWRPNGSSTGHVRLHSDLLKDPILSLTSDLMIPRLNPWEPITTLIPSVEEWNSNEIWSNLEGQRWFSDGSKTANGTGYGLFCPDLDIELCGSLGKHANVYQAEIYAIATCAREALRHLTVAAIGPQQKILILTDSQAAIKALANPKINSKLTWDCIVALEALAAKAAVQLVWCPGHTGILGNEEADRLAKTGANRNYTGVEPPCGIGYGNAKYAIKNGKRQDHLKHWDGIKNQKHSKNYLGTPDKNRAKQLLLLERDQVRILTGLLTGHCQLRKHMHKMGLATEPFCRKCGKAEESAHHILSECEALVRARLIHLGDFILEPKEFTLISPTKTLGFIKDSGVLEG